MYRTAGNREEKRAPELSSKARPHDSHIGNSPEVALYPLLDRLRLAMLGPFHAHSIWRARRQLAHQFGLIRRREVEFASAEFFERASLEARMGAWQCDLPGEQLTWSKGTYDLFGLKQGSQIPRGQILRSYTDESLSRLEKARGEALNAGSGFRLDAEIIGPGFQKRWIRISATVQRRDGEPVRLFGIKQDVTEEMQLLKQMSYLAQHDTMTGLANRTQFHAKLSEICEPGGSGGALMLIDLDGFKDVNDSFGHALGDECLVEIGRRFSALCQSAELVARIGGDEFAVLFGPTTDLQKIEFTAQRVARAAELPMTFLGRSFHVGASIGYAFTNGEAPAAVFSRADSALYDAKAAGRRPFNGLSQAS